ncbi:Ff.00g090090.m01.CDS01 [Fusarium sp. VM40]|nr:Ff.00g090090.m01.CDS01 [Fusarium sp. VM40]
MRVLDLSKFLGHKAIAKPSTSPMSVLDPPKGVNHETAVDVKKALSFSRDTQVTSHDQLTTEEKQKLGVWLRQSSNATYAGLHATINEFYQYLEAIFENWFSDSADPGGPSVVDLTATEARIPVGTLKVDAPFSRNQIRKGTETQKSVRRAGKPVTCGVTLNYETDGLTFTWKDRHGTEISYDIISFKSGLDQTDMTSATRLQENELSLCTRA